MPKTILLLGSNEGDRRQYIEDAKLAIGEIVGEILQQSEVLETEALPDPTQGKYLNQAIEVETELTPWEVLGNIMTIEYRLGRRRSLDRFDDRTIDIDILFFEDFEIQTPILEIPHSRNLARPFVPQLLEELNYNP